MLLHFDLVLISLGRVCLVDFFTDNTVVLKVNIKTSCLTFYSNVYKCIKSIVQSVR